MKRIMIEQRNQSHRCMLALLNIAKYRDRRHR